MENCLQERECLSTPKFEFSSISINSEYTTDSEVKIAHAALMGELSGSEKASGLDWRCSWKYPNTTNSENQLKAI